MTTDEQAPVDIEQVLRDMRVERRRQVEKFGATQYREVGHEACLAILSEEVGEVARELNERRLGKPYSITNMRNELVQIATVAAAWVDAIDADLEGRE